MTNDTLKTKSRLVAWRINSLDKIVGNSFQSQEFMIGKWYWLMEYHKVPEKIQLLVKLKDDQRIPCPIASIIVHIFCSKGSPIKTTKKTRESKISYGKRFVFSERDTNTLSGTTPVTFGLEFVDLKIEDENGGKTRSIWEEDYSEENTSISDEPIQPIRRMLSDSIYTDIVINACDGSIAAHRAVLAASSPVFKIMFSGNYIEKLTSKVNMDDMSIEACKAMLNFVYGKRENNELRRHNVELILAADKYDILNFKNACEASLCEDVGAKNVFEKLEIAHMYDLLELKATCLFYLVKMGMIYELRKEYNSFILEADPELNVIVSNACLDAWQAN